ncbi:hypothetical protein L484_010190 [Morus notabilis]|uniref:Uncharacterized protein n=1 Tax=Morus notabilis TaxID=981085 RepID=W9QI40_9ROSA|nr:hypothetical protein L484_010190 [Morus notabilis]
MAMSSSAESNITLILLIESKEKKSSLCSSISSSITLLSLTANGDTSAGKKLYICGHCRQRGSDMSSIVMLNKFNVKEVGALEEKIVSVGMKEGLKLLKASLQTNTVHTDVFLD